MIENSVLGKSWISKKYNEETVSFLKNNFSLSEILSRLIAIRNIKVEDIDLFLNPKLKNILPNPFVLKDMDKSVERTLKAILEKEKLGIFGDYDVDGATSTAILGNYFKPTEKGDEIFIKKVNLYLKLNENLNNFSNDKKNEDLKVDKVENLR